MKKTILQNILSFLGVTVMAVLMYGSATTETITGRPIDETKTNSITDGKTKDIDIITLFGAPDTKTEMRSHTLYIYKYCVSKGKGVSTGYTTDIKTRESCDELTVTFDSLGTVTAHSYLKDPNMKREHPPTSKK
jgi:hypothetical protein